MTDMTDATRDAGADTTIHECLSGVSGADYPQFRLVAHRGALS